MLPTLPLYIADLGGSTQQIGIVMGCFAVGLLVARPWLGKAADQKGRKHVLGIGMIAIAIAPLGYALVDTLPLLMLLRVVHGVSLAAFATAYIAYVVDIAPPQQRGEVIGYMSLVNPLGLMLGPALGGLLQEALGYYPFFLAAAAVGGLGWLLTRLLPNVAPIQAPADASQQFWQLLPTPRLRTPTVMMLLVGLAVGTLNTFGALYIRSLEWGFNAGWFYAVAAVASFAARLLSGRRSDRWGRGVFITYSLVASTLAMAQLWRAESIAGILLAGALQGAGFGILIPMIAALMADRSLPHERGRMFSLCMIGFDVGIAIAGPALAGVAEIWSYRALFAVATGLMLTGLIIFLTSAGSDPKHSLQFALGRSPDAFALPQEQTYVV